MDPGTFSNVVSRGELSAVTKCQCVVTRTKIATDIALHTVTYRTEQHAVFLTFYTPLYRKLNLQRSSQFVTAQSHWVITNEDHLSR
jgi:hypothetical protein